MKIKKFMAPNMSEAMKQIRLELGDQAVILNSKVVQRKGFLGFMKKRNIEVIAAVDPDAGKNSPVQTAPAHGEKPARAPDASVRSEKESLQKEIAALKKVVQEVSKLANPAYQKYPLPVQKRLNAGSQQGLDESLLLVIGDALYEEWEKANGNLTEDEILKQAKALLQKKLARFTYGGSRKKYVNLIGPTGVGKTTTLAKMAAQAVLEKKEKIAFITTDTYRIAAIEQLKTYANLLNVPLEVVYKLSDFKKAIEKFSDFDRVFIDTAGRNYRELQYVRELSGLIDFHAEMETFLTLSLTMKEKDMKAVFDSFQSIRIDRFIFTKLDETSTYGAAINLMEQYEKGCAYVTNGQDVPDDMLEATPGIFAEYVFGENDK
ncbi:flagellar biosynthesis protein FlhF [Heyndrickxia faecalis]|uniref:flagellar biosynthesis protein FlhF n=1 Tax=Heyndrickxia faecalis TaxID=2824910 RepID=UPI0035989C98